MPKQLFNNDYEAKKFESTFELSVNSDDVEDAFLELIDYTPKSKVDIVFKNSSTLSFFYWTAPKEFLQLWNKIKGNEVTLIVCDHQIVSFNKEDVLYKKVSEVFEGQQ